MMKIDKLFSLIVLFLLIAFGYACDDDTMDDVSNDQENVENEEENEEDNEAPSEITLVIQFAGTYDVTSVANGSHDRNTIIISENGAIDFDSDISFEAGDVIAVFDRIECCMRIGVNYGEDDDAEVINLFLSESGSTLESVQFRHRNEDVDIEVSVEDV